MASDDEGPKFNRRGRLGRFMKLGGMAASVTGSAMAERLTRAWRPEEAREEALRATMVGNAQKMVRAMGELKGAAMKVGQMLSVVPDQVPEEVRQELAALQKDTPPMSYELVAAQFEAGTGTPLRDAFAYFDPEPIGAASIGQVHRARTFEGTEVAVKVQYPGILDTLDSDLKNLGILIQTGRMLADKERLDAFMAEIRRGILEEADYAHEAENLETFGERFSAFEGVVVPRVVRDFTSDTVLTMGYLEGEKLDQAIEKLDQPARDEACLRFARLVIWSFHEQQMLHADPHPGNFLHMPDGRLGLLDFGCVRTYDPKFTDGWLKVIVAKWRHEKDHLRELFDELGYAPMKGSKGLTNQQLHELTDITTAPFLYDREFDWGAWKPRPALEAFAKANLAVLQYASPPEAIFYFRVSAGVWGLLTRAGVKANFHRIAREVAERRGLL
ncbi:MAG: AarF/ABC1/UbiB kinase family protein [Myxococcales bacterium]|nr:AarF/ABC1/UbiB kinase family protein [Myxococcales bacterium]